MPKKTYIFMLSDKDRKRHEHITERGKVSEFIVQYETLVENKWVPIVRYDTAHGYVHKDLMNPDGSAEKILLGAVGLNDALTLADVDINKNWVRYKERFFRRIKK